MAKGGHVWQKGACMVKGVHGEGGMCGKGGHAWQRGRACVAKGGMYGI